MSLTTTPSKRKKHKLNDITDAIKEGWMPLGIYTLAHREAIFLPMKNNG